MRRGRGDASRISADGEGEEELFVADEVEEEKYAKQYLRGFIVALWILSEGL